MNDFSELENELRKLQPAEPSADLTSRIEVALADSSQSTPSAGVLPKRPRFRINWYGLGLGLTAAAIFLVLARIDVDRLQQQAPATASTGDTARSTSFKDEFVPADATRVLLATRDEGLRFLGQSDAPVRRVRSRTQETMQWRNPKTGALLRVSYPSDEVTLTPVSGQ